jgi:hypothetical protein
MSKSVIRPDMVQINAWSPGCDNVAPLSKANALATKDVSQVDDRRGERLAPPVKADPRDWRHPEVGWGLVLQDDLDLEAAVKARGEDAPEPLRRLLKDRAGALVLRWSKSQGTRSLRRYYTDGVAEQDLEIAAPRHGTKPGCLPRYLLIYGSPQQIPWSVQFALNLTFCVGRLDLEAAGLENYVNALLSDWEGIDSNPRAPVVWSVDHGKQDITWLMARAIANPLAKAFQSDTDLAENVHLKGAAATAQNLLTSLTERKPALVVSSSHGATGPLNDEPLLVEQLGLLVDVEKSPVALAGFKDWSPRGAIWYAQACCSAGSNAPSRYGSVVDADTGVGRILAGVSKAAGACVAPLPRLLLGSEAPLRAFVGHVEPTFDWTLRQPDTLEVLTGAVTNALYNELYQPGLRMPIGLALQRVFAEAGAYFTEWATEKQGINDNVPGSINRALYSQLVAMDRQSLVVLGDPTVTLPPFL